MTAPATKPLKAPFPYFGGKSRVAPVIWRRFGTVKNYVEPFFGSGAVLFAAPQHGQTETVNDLNGLLCNFWRATQADPEAVAYYADWPINELDLHARHAWLDGQAASVAELLSDPAYYDAKIAGYWVWGLSQWIGAGWCSGKRSRKMPKLGSPSADRRQIGQGIHRAEYRAAFGSLPLLNAGSGRPSGGKGIHRPEYRAAFGKLPWLAGAEGTHSVQMGVHAGRYQTAGALLDYFQALSARLRYVRVTCGDWRRVTSPSITWKHGTTAMLLDPPYARQGRADVYAHESDIFEDVRQYAIEQGERPDMRIALCGYDFDMPAGWTCHKWKASGGYANQGRGATQGKANAAKEVIWFSPACEAADD